jgi:hypothetical protein
MRVKKREVVIPFEGEEMFIVPKRGGFGQPDNENYVMAVGKTPPTSTTPQDLPNDPANTGTSGTTNTNTNTTTTPPINDETTPPTPPPATAEQMCASSGGTYVNGVCQPRVVADEPSPAETTCIANGGLYQNGVCITSNSPKPPVVTNLPNFPVWSSLDCTTLKDKIAEYNAILSTSTFTQEIVNAYNTEIAKAQFIFNTKLPPFTISVPPLKYVTSLILFIVL